MYSKPYCIILFNQTYIHKTKKIYIYIYIYDSVRLLSTTSDSNVNIYIQ